VIQTNAKQLCQFRQHKAGQGKARQGNTKPGKARQGKATQSRARKGGVLFFGAHFSNRVFRKRQVFNDNSTPHPHIKKPAK
jgi:hypothetical protein